MIRLRPKHGLCNRLRAIASARALAMARGDALEVYWDVTYDMNTRYSDLFELDGSFVLIENGSQNSFFSVDNPDYRGERTMHRGNAGLERFVHEILTSPTSRDFAFDSSSDFYDGDFSWLRPRADIEKVIKAERSLLPQHYVAMHIRRTDNFQAKFYSPLRLFVAAIKEEMSRDDAIGVFVASDDERVKNALRKKFGERCRSRNEIASRSDPTGVRDALVDLMLLSMGERVYGCYWSSFSEVAAAIGVTSSGCKNHNNARYVQLCVSGFAKKVADLRLVLVRHRLKLFSSGNRFLKLLIRVWK